MGRLFLFQSLRVFRWTMIFTILLRIGPRKVRSNRLY